MYVVYLEDCEETETDSGSFQIELAMLADMSKEWEAAEETPQELFFIDKPGDWNGVVLSKIQADEFFVVYESKDKKRMLAIQHD